MKSSAEKIIEQIAKERLGLDSLEEQGNDSLDFKEQHVLAIRDALLEALDAGYKLCREARG